MSPEDVKKLRSGLGCTARDLAAALDVDPKTVHDWERGEQFPTKRHCEKMQSLASTGLPRKRRAGGKQTGEPDDAKLAAVIRKLAANPDFLDEVERLSGDYDDPDDRG